MNWTEEDRWLWLTQRDSQISGRKRPAEWNNDDGDDDDDYDTDSGRSVDSCRMMVVVVG